MIRFAVNLRCLRIGGRSLLPGQSRHSSGRQVMKRAICWCILVGFCFSSGLAQQSPTATSTLGGNAAVPTLVNFNGIVTDSNAKPFAGMVGITFSLYKDQQGGAPLWVETQ